MGGCRQLFGYQHSLNHHLLCSTEERNLYRFETTWGWVNGDTISIFVWTIPFTCKVCSVFYSLFTRRVYGVCSQNWVLKDLFHRTNLQQLEWHTMHVNFVYIIWWQIKLNHAAAWLRRGEERREASGLWTGNTNGQESQLCWRTLTDRVRVATNAAN